MVDNFWESKIKELLVTGEYSELFYKQFVDCVKDGIYEFDFIAREIEYLEETRPDTATKKEAMFRGEVLKGLWHKHFFDATNIPLNFSKILKKQQNNICLAKGNEEDFLKKILALIPACVASTNKTGDWIVYQKRGNGNLYLTLAKHKEPDTKIFERVKTFID